MQIAKKDNKHIMLAGFGRALLWRLCLDCALF